MKKLLLLVVTIGLAMMFGIGAVNEAKAKTYRLRLQAFPPAADALYSEFIAKKLVEKIKADTGGQIIIMPFSGGALVPSSEIFKSVATSAIDMCYTTAGYHVGFMPYMQVGDGLPMAYRDYDDLMVCYNERGLGEIFRQEYAKNGVVLLAHFASDAYTVLSKKPLYTQADWRGAKVRGWGVWNKFFGLLGTSAVDMPLTDVYLGLSMGTVDACVTGINPLYQLKFYEVAKSGIWPPLTGTALHDLYISPKAWKSMPEDLQQQLIKSCREWAEETHYAWNAVAVKNKKNLEANGVAFAPIIDQEWLMERAQILWREVAAQDAASAEAIKIITDYMTEVGVIKP